MAVFGRDFYGLTKYGANTTANFDVTPFDANPDGYLAVRVTWTSPSGSWTNLRLLRSKTGYSVNPTDGLILLDTTTSADQFVDTDLQGGTWYYYTLFIKDSTGTWNRAGATSGLSVKRPWTRPINQVIGLQHESQDVPYGYADILWDRVPEFYTYVRRDGSGLTDDYFIAPDLQAFVQNPEVYDQENQHLRSFLNVLGWGLDYVHNYEDTLLRANDPHTAHLQDVNRLATELGISFEYGVPASVMRSKVANAALLARRRGTVQGLADVAALSTGWNVDIQVNQNLFLNRDQSEFANPVIAEWDSGTNYANGQQAQYEGRFWTVIPVQAPVITLGTTFTTGGTSTAGAKYWTITAINARGETVESNEVTATLVSTGRQTLNWTAVAGATGYKVYRGTSPGAQTILVATLGAVVTYTDTGIAGVAGVPPVTNTALQGAYGTAQRPPETGTNINQWWTVTTDTDVALLRNPTTDAVVTWKGWKDGTTEQGLAVSIGVSEPISSAGQTSNALVIRNGSGAHTYDVVGAANNSGVGDTLQPGPSAVIGQGIPIPRPTTWANNIEYGIGVLVKHWGVCWRSIGTSLGQEPGTGSIYWEKVGADRRPTLGYSFYAHGPFTGTGGTGGVSVVPGVSFFNSKGALLLDQVSVTPLSNFVFDTFNHTFGVPDYTSYGNWTTTGTWDTEPLDLGEDPVAYPLSTGTAVLTVPGTLLQYRVAATFAKAAATGFTDSILLRYVDSNNWMRVSRTKVEKKVAGTVTTVATHSTAFGDGDRAMVKIDDTANTFTVYRNTVSVSSGALTGGTSPYKHGIMVV